MAGPALALKYLVIFVFFGFTVLLLLYAIVRRKNLSKAVPAFLLFLILTAIATYIYYQNETSELEASKKFLGDYKLERLDRKTCDNCKVRLYDGFKYDIIVQGKIVGHGKWHIESAIDIPGYFLKVENGPNWVVWEHNRLIEFIDRTQNE